MNLIVEDIENATSPYRNNTVIAISEDDTQAGQNGRDHINDGRRFPFVLVAPHNVEKQGAATGAGCGISPGLHCGYVVHQTFNTSNVLAVMERVEMNVNPSSFALGPPTGRSTFPMVENDYLAEGNPLEPVWKCGEPGVPCNTGVVTQTLTSTSISPSTISAAINTAVGLTATASDQSGAPISSATYAWALTPSTLGSLTATTGSSVTFNAGSSAGRGHVCENATYGPTTVQDCVLAIVISSDTLGSVSITPSGPIAVTPGQFARLQASALGTNNQSLTSVTSFTWVMNPNTLASLNTSSGRWVNLTIGSGTGTLTVCINGTYGITTKMACDFVSIYLPPPVLSSVWVTPTSLTINTSETQTFYALPLDQFNKPYTSQVQYQWTLSSSTLGTVNPTSSNGNTTLFTPGTTPATGTLQVFVHNGSTSAYRTVNLNVTLPIPPIMSVSVSPSTFTLAPSDMQAFNATPTCKTPCTVAPTYSWALTNKSMGSLSATSGSSVTFTASTFTGTVVLYVNATLNGKTVSSYATITVAINSGSGPTPFLSGMVLYALIIGLLVVVAIVIIALLIRARRKGKANTPQQPAQGDRQPPRTKTPGSF